MGQMSGSASCYFRNCVFRTQLILNVFFQYSLYFVLLDLITTSNALEIQETRHISINRPVSKNSFEFPKWVQYSTDNVRCFCNLPSCVLTSYMCKSSEGACFSDILHDGSAVDSNGIHGCMELLPNKTKQRICRKIDKNISTSKKEVNSKPAIMCCYSDMCNHVDNPRVENVLNDSSLGAYGEGNENAIPTNVKTKEVPSLYTESEVWFRAATIAVPICGAVILLALIMLAVKLLRSETSKKSIHKLGKSQDIWSPNCHKSNFASPSYLHQNNLQIQIDDSYKKKINDQMLNNGQFCIPLLVEEQNSKVKKSSIGNILNNSREKESSFLRPTEMSISVMNNIRNCPSNKLTISENVSDRSNLMIEKAYYKESLPST